MPGIDYTEFGPEYILIFLGYADDAMEEAKLVTSLELSLQRELDEIRNINRAIPFTRIRIWKWNSDAQAIRGGQSVVIKPILDRANIALFLFKERVGSVTWEELKYTIGRQPAIPVLPFFNTVAPDQDRMADETVIEQWLDLVKKSKSLNAGWTDTNSNAITPLPKYSNLRELEAVSFDRLKKEIMRLVSRYVISVERGKTFDDGKISSMGHLIHKLKAKDTTDRWAYYFVLVMPEREREFLDAIEGNATIDLEDYGKVIASSYGESPTQEVKDYLKEKYGFTV